MVYSAILRFTGFLMKVATLMKRDTWEYNLLTDATKVSHDLMPDKRSRPIGCKVEIGEAAAGCTRDPVNPLASKPSNRYSSKMASG